jgi:hypothetical protein
MSSLNAVSFAPMTHLRHVLVAVFLLGGCTSTAAPEPAPDPAPNAPVSPPAESEAREQAQGSAVHVQSFQASAQPQQGGDPILWCTYSCDGCSNGFGWSGPVDARCGTISGVCAFCVELGPPGYSVYWNCSGAGC